MVDDAGVEGGGVGAAGGGEAAFFELGEGETPDEIAVGGGGGEGAGAAGAGGETDDWGRAVGGRVVGFAVP